MAGRFSLRRVAVPDLSATEEQSAPVRDGEAPIPSEEAQPEAQQAATSTLNPLVSNKLLEAKVRLHRQLIDEINLSALKSCPKMK